MRPNHFKPILLAAWLGGSQGLAAGEPVPTEAGATAEASSRHLDAVINRISSLYAHDPIFLEQMRTANRAWADYRDAQLAMRRAADPQTRTDTPKAIPVARRLQELTTDRIRPLGAWLGPLEDEPRASGDRPLDACPLSGAGN